ncbi:MAG: hypothetical protein EA380_01870 [Phycisphaeraceae bacterium]|nr:MAG: hypothetical protein EA380_01870 [Phycisphaeraceae bacterium]
MNATPMGDEARERTALRDAKRYLASYREGVLAFDGQQVPVKFVSDHADGRLVISAPVAVFFAHEHVLWVPEETLDSMQLLISAEEVGESVATDRWQAYHADPEHVRWAACWIDSARLGAWVFDGDAMVGANPLGGVESAVVKEVNADRDVLRRMCEASLGMKMESPLCVGLVPEGLHVRARFGVVLVAFDEPVETEEGVGGALAALKKRQ